MKRALIFLFLLQGCVSGVALPQVEGHAMSECETQIAETMRMQWGENGDLPDPYTNRCNEVLSSTPVAYLEDAEFENVCGPSALGCVRRAGDGQYLVAIRESSVKRGESLKVFSHEVLHLLGHCTGLGGDGDHSDRNIWTLVYWGAQQNVFSYGEWCSPGA